MEAILWDLWMQVSLGNNWENFTKMQISPGLESYKLQTRSAAMEGLQLKGLLCTEKSSPKNKTKKMRRLLKIMVCVSTDSPWNVSHEIIQYRIRFNIPSHKEIKFVSHPLLNQVFTWKEKRLPWLSHYTEFQCSWYTDVSVTWNVCANTCYPLHIFSLKRDYRMIADNLSRLHIVPWPVNCIVHYNSHMKGSCSKGGKSYLGKNW